MDAVDTATAPAMSCDDSVAQLTMRAREAAVASAALLRAVVAVADSARPGFDADEVSFALAWTQTAARGQVAFGRFLATVLPAVFAAWSAGDIDAHRAWVFYDVLAVVDEAVAIDIAARVLLAAGGLTTSQLRDRLRRAVLRADPAGAADRTRRTVTERHVATAADRDGTASLYGVRLPADRTVAAFERVDAYARARKLDGDGRSLDQLRADTFLDLLTGAAIDTAPIHRVGVIALTVPWATAVGLGSDPATLAGYGPVPAAVARDIIREMTHEAGVRRGDRAGGPPSSRVDGQGDNRADGRAGSRAGGQASGQTSGQGRDRAGDRRPGGHFQWRFSVIGPQGELLRHGATTATSPGPRATSSDPRAASPGSRAGDRLRPRPPVEDDPRRRAPGPALARWIVARDGTCRAPGCRAPAHVGDLDHTVPYAAGGSTTHDNLAVLCRHHHRMRHNGGWHLTQPTPGTLEWRSPTGHTYRREPDPPPSGSEEN